MKTQDSIRRITLAPDNPNRLAQLCGPLDDNLQLIEQHLNVEIRNRGNQFQIRGTPQSIDQTCDVLSELYEKTKHQKIISINDILLLVKSASYSTMSEKQKHPLTHPEVKRQKAAIKARTPNQQHYLNAIQEYDINFGIGPSGTGKTFLAVTSALMALEHEIVERIILVRPAVEAGESLGFLPGDLTQKIDPYLRPLYDALCEMLGSAKVGQFIEKGIIEIAPLAYMRGRTLNNAFIILDEGQNATKEQMKMFLTRIGFGSKAVITGDITQTDLPRKSDSGLAHAMSLFQAIEAIKFTFFKPNDIVRHPLVQKIIEVYEAETTHEH